MERKFHKAFNLTVYRRCKSMYRLTVLFDILLIASSIAFLSFHKGNKALIVGPLVAGILVKLGSIVLVYFKLEQIMLTMLLVTVFSSLSYFVFFFELKASADVATVNTTLAQDEWKIQGLIVSTGWLTNAVVLSALATITRNRYHAIIVMLVMDASYGALYALEDACSAAANCVVLATLMLIFTVYSFTVSYSSFLYEVEIRKGKNLAGYLLQTLERLVCRFSNRADCKEKRYARSRTRGFLPESKVQCEPASPRS